MAIALSGRQAGITFVPKGSAAIFLCQRRSSAGSSVVQTTSTPNLRMRAWPRNSGVASFALHSSKISRAVAGHRSLSMPNTRLSSRCVQWYSGFRIVYGTVSAHFSKVSQAVCLPPVR